MAKSKAALARANKLKETQLRSYGEYVKNFKKNQSEGLIFATSKSAAPQMMSFEQFQVRKNIFKAQGFDASAKGLANSQLRTFTLAESGALYKSLGTQYKAIKEGTSSLSEEAQEYVKTIYEQLHRMTSPQRIDYMQRFGFKIRDQLDDLTDLDDFYNSP